MSYITATGIAVPRQPLDQSTISRFMEIMMGKEDSDVRRKIKAIFRASGIRQRHSVLVDYGRTSDFTFYPNNDTDPFPGTESRMNVFREHALPLSVEAVSNMMTRVPVKAEEITHLIVVSCTGMYAPGLDIDLVKALKLRTNIQRICIQFMGCYAAFNALKVANTICRSEAHEKVLIVCAELCSIHFQPEPTDDNILANALFADGAAAMLVTSDKINPRSLEVVSSFNDLALKGESDMAWNVGDHGFRMRLSSYVPDLIKGEIGSLLERFLSTSNVLRPDIAHYAMHPGGTRILQIIEECLGLTRDDNAHAYEVLRKYGNMSSATVVFVLDKIIQELHPDQNNKMVLSIGFGPGLTLESMLYKIHA